MERNVLSDAISMATDTMYKTDGEIYGYPATFEQGQHVLEGTRQHVTLRGKMQIDDDGAYHFKPCVQTCTSRYLNEVRGNGWVLRETKQKVKIIIDLPVIKTQAPNYLVLWNRFTEAYQAFKNYFKH